MKSSSISNKTKGIIFILDIGWNGKDIMLLKNHSLDNIDIETLLPDK